MPQEIYAGCGEGPLRAPQPQARLSNPPRHPTHPAQLGGGVCNEAVACRRMGVHRWAEGNTTNVQLEGAGLGRAHCNPARWRCLYCLRDDGLCVGLQTHTNDEVSIAMAWGVSRD